MDLDAHLAGFGAEMDALDFGQAVRVIEDEFITPANWKYCLDTNFENYHLPVLHGETLARVFAHNLTLFDTWGPHHRFTFPHATIYDWMKEPEGDWPIGGLPFLYFLFPNVNIAIGSVTQNGGLFSVSRLFPTAVGELVTKVAVYAPQGVKSPEHLADIEKAFASIRRAIRDEDYSVTGESWAGFSTLPPGTKLPIGRHEIGVQNFHHNVRKYAGG
jgi:phenylpropionate dioxygenase-like ring-hydroxylating dioxygenase large terminal subunit